MPGITPNEGETLIANILYARDLTDRAADLEIGLFTNTTVDETTGIVDITEPTGGGYARKDLLDGEWSITGGTAEYADKVWTVTGTDYSAPVYGYFIVTKGTTPRLLHIQVDNNGPRAMTVGADYTISPNNVVD